VVDKFVLVEATRTFSNKEKPLYFEENKSRFAKFSDRIIYIKLTELPEYKTDWTYENYQRNMIMSGLSECSPDDVILISDLDEIPNPQAIFEYRKDGIKALQQLSFSCFLNYKSIIFKYWYGTKILCYKDILNDETEKHEYEYSKFLIQDLNKGCTPTKIRIISDFPVIKKGGWHFTYLGGVKKIQYKLDSFAHQEFNTSAYVDEKALEKKLQKGLDLFRPRENRFAVVKISDILPKYIIDNREKFEDLIYPYTSTTAVRNLINTVCACIENYLIFRPTQKIKHLLRRALRAK
jgi:beta-1,4-mannosyl-glycoprotein beta-1,4-N-acetylglucosaminyltransferase